MSNRESISFDDLDQVVGGAIRWKPDGTCFDKNNPDVVFHFDIHRFDEIQQYLLQNNGGRAQDINSLYMLREAGYVW